MPADRSPSKTSRADYCSCTHADYGSDDMVSLGLCEKTAVCVHEEDLDITGTQIDAALQKVINAQMRRLRPLFEQNAPVASQMLLVHVQGIASDSMFNSLAKTCSWCVSHSLTDSHPLHPPRPVSRFCPYVLGLVPVPQLPYT